MRLFIIIVFFSTSISLYASDSWSHKKNFKKLLRKRLISAFNLERDMNSSGYSNEQSVAILTSLSLHKKITNMQREHPVFRSLYEEEILRVNE